MKKSNFLLHDNILRASDAGEISRQDCARLLLDINEMWTPSHSVDPSDWTTAEIEKHLETLGFVFGVFSARDIESGYRVDKDGGLEQIADVPDYGAIERFDGATVYAVRQPSDHEWDFVRDSIEDCVEAAWDYYAPFYSPAYYYNWAPKARRAA